MSDDDDPRRVFGELVRDARTAMGMTQGDLAKVLDTTQDFISRLENGTKDPRLLLMYELAAALEDRLDIKCAWIKLRNRSWDRPPLDLTDDNVNNS